MRARGGVIVHLDATLICEAPKIGPHREAMRAAVAEIAGLDVGPRRRQGDHHRAAWVYGPRRGDRLPRDRDSAAIATTDKEMCMIPHDTHLHIGSLLFEGVDQIDLTGPFEVLSRIPNATYRIYGKTAEPIRDVKGLRLTPDAALPMLRHWTFFTYRAALARKP